MRGWWMLVAVWMLMGGSAWAQTISSDLRPGTAMTLTMWASATQTAPLEFPVGTALRLAWEPVESESAHEITRYEVQVDDGAWVAAGVTIPAVEYRFILPSEALTRGSHVLGLRACNERGCTETPASVSYDIVLPLPGVPRVPRVEPVPPQATLTIPEAEQRAQAYALWALDRHLTASEMGWLAVRWPVGQPLTKWTLLTYLDEQVSR